MKNLTKPSKFVFSDGLDAKFLDRNYMGNIQLASKIFHVFLSTAEQDLEKLEQAVATSNYHEVYQITHKVKNNYMHVGLTELSKLYHDIETAAKQKSKDLPYIFKKINTVSRENINLVKFELQRINLFLAN